METAADRAILTKIVATLGPATAKPETIVKMIREGVNVFRINFSHGTFDQFRALLEAVRQAETEVGASIGVLGDLSGPKLRVGRLNENGVTLEQESRVMFVAEAAAPKPEEGTSHENKPLRLPVPDPSWLSEIEIGQRVLLDDGRLVLRCVDKTTPAQNPEVICEVVHGGQLTSSKGINLPDTHLTMPSLTAHDQRCVEFAVEQGFDFLALSFVKSGADIRDLKDRLRTLGARPATPKRARTGERHDFSSYGGGSRAFIPVMAKIEKPQALDTLSEIVIEADLVMVARGDLGVETDFAQVPVLQKRIIEACHEHGKPAVVATQMLQSMTHSPSPTRAEASDVANAIFDGADAVMLSGETAIGKYPIETVQVMRRIASRTNQHLRAQSEPVSPPSRLRVSKYRTAALAYGVGVVVQALEARLIAMWSSLGGGASYLSQNRLPLPVMAFSDSTEALRRMSILYGVTPCRMTRPETAAAFTQLVDQFLLAENWAEKGDPIVLVLGQPIGEPGVTNQIHIHYVGDDESQTPKS